MARSRLVIRKTLETRPHWSLRTRAKATGHAPSTIHRIWRAFSLQPHRSETFKLSSDPHFVEKVRDIVGIYLAARSARLCCASMKRARSRRLIVSSIFGNDRQCVLHNFDRPKTSCSLLSSRNGNHAAGFVGDECDDPVERGGTSSSVRGRAIEGYAAAKAAVLWPTLRRDFHLITTNRPSESRSCSRPKTFDGRRIRMFWRKVSASKVDPSGVARKPQPNQKEW